MPMEAVPAAGASCFHLARPIVHPNACFVPTAPRLRSRAGHRPATMARVWTIVCPCGQVHFRAFAHFRAEME